MTERKRSDEMVAGESFEPLILTVPPEFNQQYLDAVENQHPRYLQLTKATPAIVHPSLLLNYSNITKPPSFNLPSDMAAVLTHDEVTFLNPGIVGDTFCVSWKVAEIYEKRGRRYQVKDVLVTDSHGNEILRRKMTDTYFTKKELQ